MQKKPFAKRPESAKDQEAREEVRTSVILLVLRVSLMAAAALAIAWPLTTSIGSIFCAIGAALGVLSGTWFGRSRVRQWAIVVVSGLGFLFVQILAGSLVSWGWPTALLSGRGALELAEMMRWGMGALFLFLLLRASAHRYPSFSVFELVLPLLAAASLFSAHREGNIHRPQQLVDFALERGQDPTWYLRLLGVGGSVFLAVGLLRLRKGIQIFGGMALILLLMLGMFFVSLNVPKATLLSLKQRFGKNGKEKARAKSKKQGAKGKQKKSQKRSKKNKKRKNKMKFQPPTQRKREKQKIVAVVIFKNDYRPPSNIYYFRQRVLSQFNGIRFVQSARGDVDRDRVLHFPVLNTQIKVRSSVKRPTSTIKQKIGQKPSKKTAKGKRRKHLSTRALLMLLRKEQKERKNDKVRLVKVKTIVAVMYDHSNPFGLVSPRLYRGLPNPNPGVFLRSYSVTSQAWSGQVFPRFRLTKDEYLPLLLAKHFPLVSHKVGESWWSKAAWAYYTRPPEDPRYRALLAKILSLLKKEGAPDTLTNKKMARLYAIKYWLQKNAAYSMRIKAPPSSRDHVAHFLFKTKIGYCVHFSHAAVYLARLAGIPARVAEGYAVPAKERGTGSSLLVRAGAAHAWPEVYLRGLGWVVFDIYPRRNLDAQRPRPPDPNRRKMLASLARPKKIPPLKKEMAAATKKRKTKWNWSWLSWWLGLPWYLLPLFVLSALFLLKWWRRMAYLWAPKDKRVLFYYRSLEDRLSEQGIRREAGETLEHFASRFETSMPALRLLLGQVSASYLGSRLASMDLDAAQVSTLGKQYRSFFPWYKRLLRTLDPISWAGHIFHRWRYFPPIWWLKWLDVWEQINHQLNRVLFLFRRAR